MTESDLGGRVKELERELRDLRSRVSAGAAPPPAPRETRRHMMFFDRVKLLVVMAVLFAFFVWNDASQNPIKPISDAFDDTVRSKTWLLWLFSLEILRQIHFLVSEQSAGYHGFWTEHVWGAWERFTERFKPWTRFRVARAAKWAAVVMLAAFFFASRWDVSPVQAIFDAPSHFYDTLFKPAQGMPLLIYVTFIMGMAIMQFVAIFWFMSRGGMDTYMPDDIKTRFTDVWGQDAVLERVKENIVFLEKPEEVEKRGGHVPGGILLWGPPGTGKTLMAEAVAGETGRPFVFVDPGAFINMFMGVGILKVKSLFRKLRKLALRYGGVIVFFDEADSLGNRGALAGGFPQPAFTPDQAERFEHLRWLSPNSQRAVLETQFAAAPAAPADEPKRWRDRIIMGGMGGGGMGTLQSLLAEMSGLKKPRGMFNRHLRRLLGMKPKPPPKYRILVMMATNMPESLDEAMLRPGRIDRLYKVGYPSKEGRKRTYLGYLNKVHHELTDDDVEKLATITPYATGATIKDLVNEALIVAYRDGREVITWPDVLRAKQMKELGPGEDVEYIERERHAIAIHEACHAVSAYMERKHLTIDIATIEKGGTYLGMVSSIKPEDQFTRWRTEYEADIVVSLASLAGERLFFDGDNSSGVSGDLESATSIATFMEGYWGMGSTVASHAATKRIGVGGGGPPVGDDKDEKDLLKGSLGHRIERQLSEQLRRAEQLLTENRTLVLAVAHALETHKTLSGEDIAAIMEGTRGPVVDGRLYHLPEFPEIAESYHAMAVRAHQGHDKVEVPLPKLSGRAPTLEVVAMSGMAIDGATEEPA